MSHNSSVRWTCPSLVRWQNIQLIITLTISTCLVSPWKTKPNVLFVQGRGSWLWDIYMETKRSLSITEIWMWANPCFGIDLSVTQTLGTLRYEDNTMPTIVFSKFNEDFFLYHRHLIWHVPGSCKAVVPVNIVHNVVQNVSWETINAEMFSLILKYDLEADLIDLLSRISPLGSKKLLVIRCITAKP